MMVCRCIRSMAHLTGRTLVLKEEDLAAWFASVGITTPISYDTLPDESPTNVHAVSVSGGLGLELEDTLEKPTFTVLTRGSSGGVARDLHAALDQAWIDADPDFLIGEFRVLGKGRVGGATQGSYVLNDENRRVVRSANY